MAEMPQGTMALAGAGDRAFLEAVTLAGFRRFSCAPRGPNADVGFVEAKAVAELAAERSAKPAACCSTTTNTAA